MSDAVARFAPPRPRHLAEVIPLAAARPQTELGLEIVESLPETESVTIETPDVTISVSNGIADVGDDLDKADFNRNLAEDIDESALAALAQFVLDSVQSDLTSRQEWEDTANRAASLLGIKLEDPTTSVTADGTVSKGIATCMLEAAVKLWGTARAELLPAGGPVRVRRDTAEANGRRAARELNVQGLTNGLPGIGGLPGLLPEADADLDMADDDLAIALEKDLNTFLTTTDREYYPDFSRMLFSRVVIGNAFRKVYACPVRRRPASVWVRAQDLIVSNDCTHLSGADRVTERIRISQPRMKRLQKVGHYRDIALIQPTGQPTDTEEAVASAQGTEAQPNHSWDADHLVYECYLELSSDIGNGLLGGLDVLDRDESGHAPGYALPYRVSIDVDSQQVLEIRRNWRMGDSDYRLRGRYVKYGFIPGLGFYDLGLIHLVGNPTMSATMIQRAMTDATLYANFPGGLWLQGSNRTPQTIVRPNPGEWKGVPSGGATRIQDTFMPLPYRAPGQQEFALLEKYEADVRRLAGLIELPVGEAGLSNVPVGTIMSYMEQVAQVPGAVHKDDHVAQAEEFALLRELFCEDPEALWRGRASPARKWAVRAEIEDRDLIPAADPNTPSHHHRVMKAQALVALGGSPQFTGIADQRAIYRYSLAVLGIDDPDEMTLPPAPPGANAPDPKVVAAQMKMETERMKGQQRMQAEQMKHDGDMAELRLRAEETAIRSRAEMMRAGSQMDIERLRVANQAGQQAAQRIHNLVNNTADRAQADRQHEDEMRREDADRMAQMWIAEQNADRARPSGEGG